MAAEPINDHIFHIFLIPRWRYGRKDILTSLWFSVAGILCKGSSSIDGTE